MPSFSFQWALVSGILKKEISNITGTVVMGVKEVNGG